MTTPPQIPIKILGFAFPGGIVTVSPDSNIGPDAMWFARRGNTVYVLACHKKMELVALDISKIGALLLDGPQPMCYAARWLATQLGCNPGSTAPKWYRIGDNDGPVAYELQCRYRKTVIVHDDDDGPIGEFDGTIGLRVRGINEHKNSPDLDAIVLALACMTVGNK